MLSTFTLRAQVHVSGIVTDSSDKNTISFAHVSLLKQTDSTFYIGTVTDFAGVYQFNGIEIGRYILNVSYIGYEDYMESIRIVLPSSGNLLVKNITLEKATLELSGAVVNESSIVHNVDYQSYYFTDTQKKNALHAKDLIAGLPAFDEEPLTGNIESANGTKPVILINGIKASEIELRSIPPHKVKKVEHYDIPPARYATAENVINIITSRLDNGLSVGGQTMTGVNSGFSNDLAYLSCTMGDHRVDFSYQLEYRNYKTREIDISYDYIINNEFYKDYNHGIEHFGYTNHNAFLRYAYIKPKRILQISISPVINGDFSNGVYNGLYQINTFRSERERKQNDQNKTIHPSADFYYWLQTKSGGEWAFNMHATFFNTRGDRYQCESDLGSMAEIYSDRMILNNNKYGIISEWVYSKSLSSVVFNSGYKVEYAHLKSNISNLYGRFDYTSDYLRQYVYGELSGRHQKMLYRLSIGLTHLYNNSYSNTYNKVLFTPKIISGYNFSPVTSLRLGISSEPIIPNINMLSNNAVRLTPDIISKGNPNLKSGSNTALVLMCNHDNKYLNLSTGIIASYANKPIEQSFIYDVDNLVLTHRNSEYAYYIGGQINILLKPFGTDVFSLKAFAKPCWQKIDSGDVINKVFSVENLLRASFCYKGWTLDYQYSIPTLVYNGAFLTLTENTNNLTVNYRYKNWRITFGALFLGEPSHYKTQSLVSSIVEYRNDRKIYDNRNMLVLGVEFNFLSGKNRQIERKISNNDVIAPIY